jgi:hypothetical protein
LDRAKASRRSGERENHERSQPAESPKAKLSEA